MGDESVPDGGVAAGDATRPLGLPRWAALALPLVLLVVVIGAFVVAAPLADVQSGSPLPDVTVTHVTLPSDERVVLHVTNNGPDPVTVSQVLVDEAYWDFEVSGDDRTLGRMETATITIPYHWTPEWDLEVALVLSGGATVHHTIVAPSQTPGLTLDLLWSLALIGLFVGVIPVVLGMLWFPYIRSMSDRSLHAVLLFAVGLLTFLAVDAGAEALELAEQVPGTFEGTALVALGVGAILQVDWEIARMVHRAGGRVGSARNLLAFLAGFAIMYATDLFVAL